MSFLDILATTNYWGNLQFPQGKPRAHYIEWLVEQQTAPVVSAVMGVRRAGKSTILKQVVLALIENKAIPPQNTLLVNFEDPRLVPLFSDNAVFDLWQSFKKTTDAEHPLVLVLDEVQVLPGWEAIVRTLLDQEPRLKIYITGSSAHLLGQELATKLAGRYLKTEVFPLSFEEYQDFSEGTVLDFLEWGGFPDPVLLDNEQVRAQLLKDYYESILLKDITARHQLRNDLKLRQLSAYLMANIANQASSYRLSKDIEVSPDTVLQYFEYLVDAYLGFFVPRFSASVRKQTYNPKKFYAIDTGLQSAVSFRVMDDRGKLLENAVFLALRRQFSEIFYWQEKQELDFLVKEKERVQWLVNACVSLDQPATREREVGSLVEAMDFFEKDEGVLVTLEDRSEVIETPVGRIRVVPFAQLFQVIA